MTKKKMRTTLTFPGWLSIWVDEVFIGEFPDGNSPAHDLRVASALAALGYVEVGDSRPTVEKDVYASGDTWVGRVEPLERILTGEPVYASGEPVVTDSLIRRTEDLLWREVQGLNEAFMGRFVLCGPTTEREFVGLDCYDVRTGDERLLTHVGDATNTRA